jgi:hypothetical protein
MQFIKNTSSSKRVLPLIIKLCFIIVLFLVGIFFLNKIDFPTPKKEIEKIIPNENLKTVK